MRMYPDAIAFKDAVDSANKIVIIQAENPDGDSLGTALALEHLLGDMGKEPYLYCSVDMPGYLHYLSGWDRVQKELPPQFDLSIIVDASTMTLFERLQTTTDEGKLAAKPCIVLDHHAVVENPISFATLSIIDSGRASTGELVYLLATQLHWQLSTTAQEYIMTSILGDTQGLTNQLASAETYRVMAAMIDNGVDRPALEELRREYSKMPAAIFHYKATLISRTEFAHDGMIATVIVPQAEINAFSPLYNPGPLVQNDMLQTEKVAVAVVFKQYDDGRVTGAIRCNAGYGIAADIAKELRGGGHAFASGFKVTDGRSVNQVKADCLRLASNLLTNLEKGKTDETPQYAHQTD